MAVDKQDFEELNRRKREAALLRQKHQQLVNAENQQERERLIPNVPTGQPATVPQTRGEKISNFFYHNKVAIILVSVLVAFLILCAWLLLSQERYDMELTYLPTSSYDETQTNAMAEKLEALSEGLKDDGAALRVSINPILIGTGSSYSAETDSTDLSKLKMTFYLDESFLYLCTESTYETLVNIGSVTFRDLTDLSAEADGSRVAVNDNPVFSDLQADEALYLMICDPSTVDEGNLDDYEQSLELLRRILAAQP